MWRDNRTGMRLGLILIKSDAVRCAQKCFKTGIRDSGLEKRLERVLGSARGAEARDGVSHRGVESANQTFLRAVATGSKGGI